MHEQISNLKGVLSKYSASWCFVHDGSMNPLCFFFFLKLAWLGTGNHELERWNCGTWKSSCAARGVVFCKGLILMSIFVAGCCLCCAAAYLQFHLESHNLTPTASSCVGERKKTNNTLLHGAVGSHLDGICASTVKIAVATTTAPDPCPFGRGVMGVF